MTRQEFMQTLASLSTTELAKLYAEATDENKKHIFDEDAKLQQVREDLKNIKPL